MSITVIAEATDMAQKFVDAMRSHSQVLTDEEIAKTLEDSADLFESERVGWCRHTYYGGKENDPGEPDLNSDGTVVSACALGAIRTVIMGTLVYDKLSNWDETARRAEAQVANILAHYLHEHVPHPEADRGYEWSGIDDLNDYWMTTKEQVIDAMKGAAKELRNDAS